MKLEMKPNGALVDEEGKMHARIVYAKGGLAEAMRAAAERYLIGQHPPTDYMARFEKAWGSLSDIDWRSEQPDASSACGNAPLSSTPSDGGQPGCEVCGGTGEIETMDTLSEGAWPLMCDCTRKREG